MEGNMKSRFWVALGIVIMVIMLMAGQERGYGQAPTSTALATFEVAETMEVAPSNCGILPKPMAIDPQIGEAIGAWPVWLSVSGRDGVLIFPTTHYQTRDQLPGWWMTKMGWFVSKTYKGKVEIRAFNLADGSPIYFEFADDLTTVGVLDPDKPGGFVDGITEWAFFPSLEWISKAGCYQIEARWGGGMWQQVVAVGSTR
jgi:hypothetical protein